MKLPKLVVPAMIEKLPDVLVKKPDSVKNPQWTGAVVLAGPRPTSSRAIRACSTAPGWPTSRASTPSAGSSRS